MAEMFTQVRLLANALNYHRDRHSVLSSNIANADTPEFRPKDLVRRVATNPSRDVAIARTEGGHMNHNGTTHGDLMKVTVDRTAQPGLDGNAVNLEREMSKLGANTLRYEAAAKMVARQLANLKYAANDGKGA